MKRTAFVIPWFGPDLVGGAEQHVFQVATRLAKRGHRIEVLTTCCRSFRDPWHQNALPEGASETSGVTVRRFPVDGRNAAAFDAANREMLELNERPKRVGINPVSERAARTFVDENIRSRALFDFLEREHEGYGSIVFAPYLYGPTLLGMGRVGDRAVLHPLLHDETYAYLPQVETTFHEARRVLFISEGEAMLAARLFGPGIWRKGIVTGAGVETAEHARSRANGEGQVSLLASGSFLLYVGRRDRTKNTDFLLRAFQRYRSQHHGSGLQLALAGPGELEGEESRNGGIVDLGIIPADRMTWLLDHCTALVQPSRHESYSRTIMESWLHGRPVVGHAECLATRLAIESAGGGWTAATEAEWADVFAKLESEGPAALASRGQRGREYASVHADWNRAIDRYESALELRAAPRAFRRNDKTRAIHQLLPNLAYGDAISNQATFIREVLRDAGYRSEILVEHHDEAMRDLATVFSPGALRPGDGLLFHHSIATALTPHAVGHRGPKALVYHNVTPASFFEHWDPAFAKLLERGRADLRQLAPAFPVSAGVSAYNAAELREAGFHAPRTLPIFVDPLRWDQPADPAWMRVLQDGRTNLLFVGRVAPNKCQNHLLEAFEKYLSFDADARLILVGGWQDGHPYALNLRDLAHRLGIAGHVLFARHCTDAQLLACYRTAHLFWSMSEHEGFCVPLVEAMWFDVPVLAYRSSAVPETLAGAGLMFTEKKWPELAALAHLLVEDRDLRDKVVAAQRARRAAFLPEAVLPAFLELIRAMTGETSSVLAAS